MLTSLNIKNFRMLEDFEVTKLGRINLIVGKNNSGKSTILEALRIFAGNANPALLEQIAIGHDEKIRINRDDSLDDISELPFQDFFTGRLFPRDESRIYIGEADKETKKYIKISHLYYIEEKEEVRETESEVLTRTKRKFISKSDILENSDGYLKQALTITTGKVDRLGILDFDEPRSRRTAGMYWESIDSLPSSHIPTQFISIDDLADIWDEILFSDYEAFVKRGLAIISEDFENFAFVKSDEYERIRARVESNRALRRTCKIKLKGVNRAVPLNSLGDGMLRVLQLMLKIYPAKGGFLLIDEFENGLHYSVQEKIWALLFDLAEKLDIQVFATTHSWDCIESFAKVAIERKDIEGVLFRVGRSILKSDQGKVIATVFDEDKLATLTQADVEVR